jgi:serine/threonine protein kinase
MATVLKKSSFTRFKTDTSKYKLDCQSRIDKNTDKWLHVLQKIPKVQIMIGKIDITQKTIVVKFESYEEMEKEFIISKQIYNTKIPNFIKYYCFFSCDENVDKFKILETERKKLPLCEKPGKNTGFIIMPFYQMGSIANCRWKRETLSILKNILVQVIYALFSSYRELRFIHLDLHLDNILLRKTKKQEVEYKPISKKIKTLGIYPIIMDFGRAKTAGSYREFKTSLMKMFTLLRDISEYTEFILDPLPIVNYINQSGDNINLDILVTKINNMKIDYIKR